MSGLFRSGRAAGVWPGGGKTNWYDNKDGMFVSSAAPCLPFLGQLFFSLTSANTTTMAAILPTAYPDARQQAQNGAAVDNIDHSLDGESRFGEIVAILIVGSVLSSVAVGLRAFTRLCMLRTFGMDDMVMIAAQVGRSFSMSTCTGRRS